MTPIRTLTFALVCAVALTCVQTAHAQTPVCKIYGTVDSVAGPTSTLTTTRAQITVTRASKSGSLFLNTSRVFSADATGRIEFYAPRTVGTDTAVIHIRANFGDLSAGQTVYIPDADSAELRTLPRYTANPTFVVVAVPSGGGSGDTSLSGHPRLTRIENVEGQFTAGTSDSLQQAQADAKLALNISQGKAGADSVHTVLVTLSNLIAGKGSADSIHTQLATLYNLVAGKPSADSVHTAIAAMLKMSDTTALHAQRFALINDSLFAISLRATSTANDLTAHAGTADAHLPSQTGASGKFLQSNGTVSSWQTALTAETDPTAIPRTDSTRFVSRTAPQIPGLASADTNTVIGVDASGNLVLRKDDAGGGAAIDSTTLFVERFAWQRGTLSITPIRPGDTLRVTSIVNTTWAQPVRFGPEISILNGATIGNMFIGKWVGTDTSYGVIAHRNFRNGSQYAFIQENTGAVYFNSVGTMWFNISSTGKMQMTATELVSRTNNDLALGTRALRWRELWVQGRGTFGDTLRVGDYTTFSWIKPGDAAWTASSTIDVKRDIAPTDTTSVTDTRSILARVASVDPVRYRFRPQVFRVPFDTSYANGTWFTLKLAQRQVMREEYRIMDSLRAEEKAAGYLTGFLAEQFNSAFGDPNSKEISYSDVIAVEWRAIQALIRRSRLQEQRIKALEETIKAMDARLRAGGL